MKITKDSGIESLKFDNAEEFIKFSSLCQMVSRRLYKAHKQLGGGDDGETFW